MKPASKMEPREIIDALMADDLRSKVRSVLSRLVAHSERVEPGIESRRRELATAERVIELCQTFK